MQNKLTNYLLAVIAVLLACFLLLVIYTMFFKPEACEKAYLYEQSFQDGNPHTPTTQQIAKSQGLWAACARSSN